jgi:DNA-binding LytR/AlgR family response regulator
MNILFIEDDRELLEIGVVQLQQHNTVYPASNLVDARAIMENPAMRVQLVVADQRLPDGQGVEFVIEMKALFPDCMYTIVSGCLTDSNISKLEENEISYHHKPLLYAKMLERFRRAHLMKVPCCETVAVAPCDEAVAVAPCDEVVAGAPCDEVVAGAPCDKVQEIETPSENPSEEGLGKSEAPKRKKWFGLL